MWWHESAPKLWGWENCLYYSCVMNRSCGSTGRGEMPPLCPTIHQSLWWVTGGPEVIREGELVHSLYSCHTQDIGPYAILGQHSRAGPESLGAEDSTLRTWKLENWPHLSLFIARGAPPSAIQEILPWWWGRGKTDMMTNPATTEAQKQGYVLATPTSTLYVICWSTWREQSCRPKVAGFLQHRAT